MSYRDVMILCSDFLVGKPLCMCIRTAMVHLHICQHPHQNPKYYESSELLHLFPIPFSIPVTYIRVNNPSINNNIGKFNLPNIWDRVLLNTKGLNLKSQGNNNNTQHN